MGRFSRRFAGLQALFPGSSAQQTYPAEAQDFIQPVVEIPGRAERIGDVAAFELIGAPGASPLSTGIAPADVVSYIWFAHAFHNDPVARNLIWAVQDTRLNLVVILQDSVVDDPIAPIATSQAWPLRRGIFLPPGFRLQVYVTGLAAGQVITMRGMAINLGPSDPVPPLY